MTGIKIVPNQWGSKAKLKLPNSRGWQEQNQDNIHIKSPITINLQDKEIVVEKRQTKNGVA